MYIKIASIIVLAATAVVASPTPTLTIREQSVNPPASVIRARNVQTLSQVRARYLTNARRLALGLPLKPPKAKRDSWHHSASASASASAQPSSSATPASTGYIQAIDSDTGEPIGYVANKVNSFGEYGITTKSKDDALKVKFNSAVSARSADLETLNGPDSKYPFIGAINGYASSSKDIGSGSPNYQYLGGTKQTARYSRPSNAGNTFTAVTNIAETSESAIFKYDSDTTIITPSYVNTDGSKPHTYAGINKDGVLILTGDKSAFIDSFGSAVWVIFKLVPA